MKAGADLGIKSDAHEVAIPPNQAATAAGPKVVEGQRKIQRQECHILCANAGSPVCDVQNATGAHAPVSKKKQQMRL